MAIGDPRPDIVTYTSTMVPGQKILSNEVKGVVTRIGNVPCEILAEDPILEGDTWEGRCYFCQKDQQLKVIKSGGTIVILG